MRLPVVLTLRRSASLALWIVAAHGLAAAAMSMVMSGGTLAWPTAVIAGIAVSLVFSLRRHIVHQPVKTLVLKADGSMDVDLGQGRRAAAVRPETTVLARLVVLQLKIDGRAHSVTLPRDAVGSEGHRQLRLWLRWKASGASA